MPRSELKYRRLTIPSVIGWPFLLVIFLMLTGCELARGNMACETVLGVRVCSTPEEVAANLVNFQQYLEESGSLPPSEIGWQRGDSVIHSKWNDVLMEHVGSDDGSDWTLAGMLSLLAGVPLVSEGPDPVWFTTWVENGKIQIRRGQYSLKNEMNRLLKEIQITCGKDYSDDSKTVSTFYPDFNQQYFDYVQSIMPAADREQFALNVKNYLSRFVGAKIMFIEYTIYLTRGDRPVFFLDDETSKYLNIKVAAVNTFGVLMLNKSAFKELSLEDQDLVLAHEAAHLRFTRYIDIIGNLMLQMANAGDTVDRSAISSATARSAAGSSEKTTQDHQSHTQKMIQFRKALFSARRQELLVDAYVSGLTEVDYRRYDILVSRMETVDPDRKAVVNAISRFLARGGSRDELLRIFTRQVYFSTMERVPLPFIEFANDIECANRMPPEFVEIGIVFERMVVDDVRAFAGDDYETRSRLRRYVLENRIF